MTSAVDSVPYVRSLTGRRARIVLIACCIVLLPLSMLAPLRLGSGGYTIAQVIDVLSAHIGLPSDPVTPTTDAVLWQLRTPRILAAAVFGAGLAVCGCTLQALTRNPLAEPYLLGISSGASAGAVTVAVLGLGSAVLGLTGGAVIGSLVSLALLMLLLRRSGLESTRVVLTGVIVSQLFSALTSLILMAAGDADATRAITVWLLGSLGSVRWPSAAAGAVLLVVVLIVMLANAGRLDALALGADTASSLGIDVRRTR